MLFARSYLESRKTGSAQHILQRTEEDKRRGYSERDRWPEIPEETRRQMFLREAESILAADPNVTAQIDSRLSGLCAVCSASSFHELARKIWVSYKDGYFYSPDGKNCYGGGIVALFEGESAGTDPEGWPLFKPTKLLAITDLNAIVRDA